MRGREWQMPQHPTKVAKKKHGTKDSGSTAKAARAASRPDRPAASLPAHEADASVKLSPEPLTLPALPTALREQFATIVRTQLQKEGTLGKLIESLVESLYNTLCNPDARATIRTQALRQQEEALQAELRKVVTFQKKLASNGAVQS